MRHYWRTAGGVLVWERPGKRVAIRGEIKVFAFRAGTDGFHGLLWLKNLKPARAPKAVKS